jgi:hypothetical protein
MNGLDHDLPGAPNNAQLRHVVEYSNAASAGRGFLFHRSISHF